jgi:thioredoxin:protein disulfide reductase
MRLSSRAIIPVALLLLFVGYSGSAAAQSPPNIRINNYFTADNVRKGGSIRGVVEMEIPSGFHVNSSRPFEKFLIPTQLTLETPKGVRVGAVSYPRALSRNLKFSKNKVSVYEGKATMRFNVTVPASYSGESIDIKARLRYQSCNDDLCFPPQTKEMTFSTKIVK